MHDQSVRAKLYCIGFAASHRQHIENQPDLVQLCIHKKKLRSNWIHCMAFWPCGSLVEATSWITFSILRVVFVVMKQDRMPKRANIKKCCASSRCEKKLPLGGLVNELCWFFFMGCWIKVSRKTRQAWNVLVLEHINKKTGNLKETWELKCHIKFDWFRGNQIEK